MSMFKKDGTLNLCLLCTASDNLEAEMILAALKKEHIPALKEDLGNAGILNIYGRNSKFGENIYVAEENVEKAKEILLGMGIPPRKKKGGSIPLL